MPKETEIPKKEIESSKKETRVPNKKIKHKMGTISGNVMGYTKVDNNIKLTRSIHPANIFVKVGIVVQNKTEWFNPYSSREMELFHDADPSLYNLLSEKGVFDEHPVDKVGNYEVKLPLGEWYYVIGACVEQNQFGFHLDENYDKIRILGKKDFKNWMNPKIEDVLVLVEDKKWKEPGFQKSEDPKTDPNTVPDGVITDSEGEEIIKKFKEQEEDRNKSS